MEKKILLGNEAIAYGLLAGGASVITSYPGTPASEIAETCMQLAHKHPGVHVEWSINEKTAFEIAYTNSIAGRRSAVAMKQVGLNVASDPVISAAYMGCTGGMVIVVADDPGPHSSQTEQDTRLFAHFAKLPVLDPGSPREALAMTGTAFAISEKYRTPVILRPTTRVCHARQNITLPVIEPQKRTACFSKDPARWAATPGPRLLLHHELNQRIVALSQDELALPQLIHGNREARRAVVASGVACAYVIDLLDSQERWQGLALYKVRLPYPSCREALDGIATAHERVLVIEETEPVIELQFTDRRNISGRIDGTIPGAGELNPEVVSRALDALTGQTPRETAPSYPDKRPSLCPGCAHRSAFYAIKKALPGGIYPSDIGCYTLGLNLGGVDTCLCMGAAISQAAGFYHAFRDRDDPPPIVATIGDSTFFHAGIPPTINARVTGARFVLVILDNASTAMTGHQPTPATGGLTSDTQGETLALEQVLAGCGIRHIAVQDPNDIPAFSETLKAAHAFTRSEGLAAVIARAACVRRTDRHSRRAFTMQVTEACTGCGSCVREFECPALVLEEGRVRIEASLCSACGVCVHVCPLQAIEAREVHP